MLGEREESGRLAYSVSRFHDEGIRQPAAAVRDQHWKLISRFPGLYSGIATERSLELYDVRSDPAELHNLAGQVPAELNRLLEELERRGKEPDDVSVELTDEARKQLRSLGYVR